MLSNEARRMALAEAREKAVTYARAADEIYGRTGEDSPETNAATMWATVAIALKAGPAMEADNPPGVLADVVTRS